MSRESSFSVTIDPISGYPATVRKIQPYKATKEYVCPGCNQEIAAGTGHVVITPQLHPEMRRHWHTPCWGRRQRI